MQKQNKISLRFIAAALTLCLLAGCNKAAPKKTSYNAEGEVSTAGDITAENGKYSFLWDSENNCAILKSKKTGKVWSTIPYGYLMQGEMSGVASVSLTSPLDITYIDTETLTVKDVKGSVGAVRNGRISSEKIENGVSVVYYFDELGFSVPVDYTLCDEGLKASIKINEIAESDYPIYQISLAPYMAAAQNSDDSYLFVPSGSGALIKAENRAQAAKYSEPVYGEDPVSVSYADTTYNEGIRLPLFGVKDKNDALLAYITDGAESAEITAEAGDTEVGYSSVKATFRLRGYDLTKIADHTGLYKYIKKFSDEHISLENATVIYSPIEEESADYVGMAKHYREILRRSGVLSKNEEKYPETALEIFGGALVKKLFLGLPYYSYLPLTTLKESNGIIMEFTGLTGENAVISLKGYLGGGLTPDKVGGGFTLNKKSGGKKALAELYADCEKNGNKLFLDCDPIRFSSSGGGYKVASDSVKTANKVRSTQVYYDTALNTQNKSTKDYFLLSRAKLFETAGKMNKMLDKYGIDGISLSSLSSLAYSDFDSTETFCKNGMAESVGKIYGELSKKHSVLSENANLYAAVLSSGITNTPIKSSEYGCFEKEVPFYQIVFKGSIPLYGAAVNTANDPNRVFLKSVESGIGLSFSFAKRYEEENNYLPYSALAGAIFEDTKESAAQYVKKAADYLKSVSGSEIKAHSSNGDISRTVFENGITVYVNYGRESANTPLGSVEPESFIYGKEG